MSQDEIQIIEKIISTKKVTSKEKAKTIKKVVEKFDEFEKIQEQRD